MKTLTQYSNVSTTADERFYIMADCAPVMLWMAGTDSRCHFFNKPWLEFSGRTMEEEIGEGWIESVHFEDFQYCVDTYMENFNKRQEFRMEYRLKRHDGVYRWILDTGRPHFGSNGQFLGFIGSCIDISDIKEARLLEIAKARLETRLEERERTNEKLAEANQDLDSFTYNVAHDLRAPIRAINNYIELYLADNDLALLPNDENKLLSKLKEKGHHLDSLLDGLIKLSRPFQIPHLKTMIETNVLVESIVANLIESNKNNKVKVELDKLPPIFGDESLIRQLFINLINNAIKFSQKSTNAHVKIGTNISENGEYIFFVKDNGVGIAAHDQEKLFQIFRRFHPEYDGTGVGLSIVRKIINRHHGKIWVESEVGKGTTFFFTLESSNA